MGEGYGGEVVEGVNEMMVTYRLRRPRYDLLEISEILLASLCPLTRVCPEKTYLNSKYDVLILLSKKSASSFAPFA